MTTLASDAVDVILRDGRTLRLRPPRREDAEHLLEFFHSLSEQSLYLRFHGFPSLEPKLVEPLLEPDWIERGALLGTLSDQGGEQVVAVANYVRLRDPLAAEAAFAVADRHQRRGIGTRLLERLAERAADVGIERFVAEVIADNRSMLGVFEAVGFEVSREFEGGELEVQFPIAATETFRRRVDERDHTAVRASLRPFFEPGTVAVIGASRRRGTIGGELFRNILSGDFAGAAYPVNRDGGPVAGVQGYASVRDIPAPVDLAVIVLPGEAVLAAADEALQAGVRALLVISAGFAEVGREGAERQERLLELVRAHGARLVGPNCLGITAAGTSLNATFASRSVTSGNIGFSSQSGALGIAFLEAAAARGLGLSAFVSIGNKADVSSNDLLEWWEEDEATDVVLLYLESFGNPRRFGRLARRVSRTKPILALKSGTTASGQRAASSHTAALAGSETAVDALFHQAGVIRATSLEELIDVAALLSSQPEAKGRRVGILTNAGGLGILCADVCDSVGLELPALSRPTHERLAELLSSEASFGNPIDMLGGATADMYAEALPLVLSDPQIDALIVLFVPTVAATADDVAQAIERAVTASNAGKPVLAVVMTSAGIPEALRDGHVAAFAYPEAAARAIGRAANRADWLRRPHGTVPELESIDHNRAEAVIASALSRGDDVWLEANETRELLLAYGLPVVAEVIVSTVDEGVSAARELDYPVVVKTALAGAHKTDIDGLALDLGDDEAVRAALSRIGTPALVQPMVAGSAELLAGIVQDPVFGPLVAFGPGGVLAELIGEAAFRIAPLTDHDAEELVLGGKAGKLVRGFRGKPAADTAALVDLVHRLARLGDDLHAVAELDLNPVIARPDGCVVVDARARVHRPERISRIKTW
jgi:acetyl coenzyme A synthetase (ADP forming)-like protein